MPIWLSLHSAVTNASKCFSTIKLLECTKELDNVFYVNCVSCLHHHLCNLYNGHNSNIVTKNSIHRFGAYYIVHAQILQQKLEFTAIATTILNCSFTKVATKTGIKKKCYSHFNNHFNIEMC